MTVVSLLALGPAAWAHRSAVGGPAACGPKWTSQGAVTKVEWESPHVWVYVDVTDDRGQTVNWSFELPSP